MACAKRVPVRLLSRLAVQAWVSRAGQALWGAHRGLGAVLVSEGSGGGPLGRRSRPGRGGARRGLEKSLLGGAVRSSWWPFLELSRAERQGAPSEEESGKAWEEGALPSQPQQG